MQITGGWVYDPEEGFAERTVCTDGEKIARSSGDAQNLDASGCYVLPLLIDLHIHGYAGADVGSAEPAELERMARALLMQGVGAFCPTTMTLPEARLAAGISPPPCDLGSNSALRPWPGTKTSQHVPGCTVRPAQTCPRSFPW